MSLRFSSKRRGTKKSRDMRDSTFVSVRGINIALTVHYQIIDLGFPDLGYWSENLFLTVPFPDLCLLVPFNYRI